jgi:uncharacterized membrane protein
MKVKIAQRLSSLTHLGLIVFAMAWVIQLSDTPIERISLYIVLFVGPLVLTLRGVLHARTKTLVYSSLIGLWYLLHGGVLWWTDVQHTYWGLLEMSLALGHILSSSLYNRWQAI